jgi:hypothetical protein
MADQREPGPPTEPPAADAGQLRQRPQMSPDGRYWWDGDRWITLDGRYWWKGEQWIAAPGSDGPPVAGELPAPAYPGPVDPHTVAAVASAGGFLAAFAAAVSKVLGEVAGNALLRVVAPPPSAFIPTWSFHQRPRCRYRLAR